MGKRKTYALGKRVLNSYNSYLRQRNEIKRKYGYGLERQMSYKAFRNVYFNMREMQEKNIIYKIIQAEKNYTYTEARLLMKRAKEKGYDIGFKSIREITKVSGKKARQEVFNQILDATGGDYEQARVVY